MDKSSKTIQRMFDEIAPTYDSVMDFDSPGELESRMRNLGFRIVESLPLWFGICHLYVVKNTGM